MFSMLQLDEFDDVFTAAEGTSVLVGSPKPLKRTANSQDVDHAC